MRRSVSIICILGIVCLGLAAAVFFWSIKKPATYEYAHLRIRFFIHGTEVDVGELVDGSGTQPFTCSGTREEVPFSLVRKDAHAIRLLWKGMRGGDLFTYLGFSFADAPKKVIRAKNYPPITHKTPTLLPETTFIYARFNDSGKFIPLEQWYANRLEDSVGVNSRIREGMWWVDVAHAHGDESEPSIDTITTNTLERIAEQAEGRLINNILGDVVVFIQETVPAQAEITKAFETFPLIAGSWCDTPLELAPRP